MLREVRDFLIQLGYTLIMQNNAALKRWWVGGVNPEIYTIYAPISNVCVCVGGAIPLCSDVTAVVRPVGLRLV